MREAEYERLLDAVSDAVALDSVASLKPTFKLPPKATNDNQLAWPLIPFPEGWYATC